MVKKPNLDTGKYIYRKPNVNFDFEIKELPWTKKQQELIQLLQHRNTKCALIQGPAGVSKSILAIYCGLQLIKQKKISDLTYIRSAVESSSSKLGFLPGDINDKFQVYATPLEDKLDELLTPGITKALKENKHIQAMPINYMRGLNFSGRLIIIDEGQNFHFDELVTTITRIGDHSRIWILGDPLQSDLHNSLKLDFTTFCGKFQDAESEENGIFNFHFGIEDIVRSDFCKFVVKKLGVYEHEVKPDFG